MLDALGIVQHHDGLSGTAKQHVADDYNYRLYSAMNSNNAVYATLIDQLMEAQTTVSASSWQWCSSTNGTYIDCPVSNYATQNHIVVVHNPSFNDQSYVKLKVQISNYNVSVWDYDAQKFNDITQNGAEVICAGRYIASKQYV